MGITIRQHIAALVAVFLALLIGVLMGAAISQQPGLEKRIDRIAEESAQEKARNDALERQLEARERSEQALLPGLVHDRLTGRRVLLVMTAVPEDASLRDAIRTALEEAGATVPLTITFRDDYAQRCAKSAVQALQNAGRPAPNPTDESADRVAEAAAAAIADAAVRGQNESLRALRKLARVDGVVRQPFDAAIVAGGSETASVRRDEVVDQPVIEALLARGLRVVGCESSQAAESYIAAYVNHQLSTVDHADTTAGQLSLVWLLAGHEGRFGTKSTADRVSPELEGL